MGAICDVTLFSNGIMEVTDETGHQLSKYKDRFCNVWPLVYLQTKEEGCTAQFYLADWWGGRVRCMPEALNKFYEEQFAPVVKTLMKNEHKEV